MVDRAPRNRAMAAILQVMDGFTGPEAEWTAQDRPWWVHFTTLGLTISAPDLLALVRAKAREVFCYSSGESMRATIPLPGLEVTESTFRSALRELVDQGTLIDSDPYKKRHKRYRLALAADAQAERDEQEANELLARMGVKGHVFQSSADQRVVIRLDLSTLRQIAEGEWARRREEVEA